ncbi:hypothetical protein DFQ26_002388 [Actinomortierella ambigua]|nr:hypothetical protein DFQ26_002388 [Actinomortierella ambigua]
MESSKDTPGASPDLWSTPVSGWDSTDTAPSPSPKATSAPRSSWDTSVRSERDSESRDITDRMASASLSDSPTDRPRPQPSSSQAARTSGTPLAGYSPGSSELSVEDAWKRFLIADKTQDFEDIRPALGAICEAMQGHDWIEIERRLREENCYTYLVAVDQPIKNDFTLVNLKGEPDQRFRLIATFYPPGCFSYGYLGRTYPRTAEENSRRLPEAGVVRDSGITRCWNCRDTGHGSKDCPMEKRPADLSMYYNKCYVCGSSDHKTRNCPDVDATMTCNNCGQSGHMSRECPEPRKIICRRCGEEGHMLAECSQPRTDVTCNNCGQDGHMARDCPEPRKVTCRRCGEEGHMAAECSQPRTDVTCNRCNEEGHMARDCPQPRNMTCRRCGEDGHMAAECSQPRTDMTCNNCGQIGHVSRDCPDPRKVTCRRCGEEGHMAKDCAEGRRLFGFSEGF